MDRPRSLVLITIDCLRADHVGFLGYDRPTTPFLDELARQSAVFGNAIVAGAPTYYSFPAIMGSRYPLALGRDVAGLAPGEPTLASALNEAGLATAGFLAGNPYLSPHFGYDAGFEVFHDFLDEKIDRPATAVENIDNTRTKWNHRLGSACRKLGPLSSFYDELYFRYGQRRVAASPKSLDELRRFPAADAIVDQALDWLARLHKRPFCLWLHFMDPHAPYYPPQRALEWMGQGSIEVNRAQYLNSYWNRSDLGEGRLKRYREEVIALYDAGIRWADAQVGRLVDALRDLGFWESCVLAVTADHGEEFLDHGGRYHAPNKITEELIRVPLLLRAPGLAKAGKIEAPFSLLHLAPTLLDALDTPIPAAFRGNSYWSKLHQGANWEEQTVIECVVGCTNPFRSEDRLAQRLLAIRETRYKLVLDFNSSEALLFDLEADPKELRPLPPEKEKSVRRRLLNRARKHMVDCVYSRDADLRLAARLRELRLEWGNPATQISA